jgi:hypothetical protein
MNSKITLLLAAMALGPAYAAPISQFFDFDLDLGGLFQGTVAFELYDASPAILRHHPYTKPPAGDVPAVPEPSGAAMMAMGLGLLGTGLALRRKSQG